MCIVINWLVYSLYIIEFERAKLIYIIENKLNTNCKINYGIRRSGKL